MPAPLFSLLADALGPTFKGLQTLSSASLGWTQAAVRRHTMRQFVPTLLRQGLSGNTILGLFKESGLGIRRTEFLGIARESRSIVRTQSYAELLEAKDRLDVSKAREVEGWWDSEFSAKLRVEWTDAETGEYMMQWVTVDVEDGELLEDVYDRARDVMTVWYSETVGFEGEGIVDMQIGDILHHRGPGG